MQKIAQQHKHVHNRLAASLSSIPKSPLLNHRYALIEFVNAGGMQR